MPLYEYQCQACGKRFEVIQKFSDPQVDVCRLCGKGPIDRLISSPAIQFKGTGWYITDYSQKGKQSGGTVPPGSSSGDSKESKESKDSDSKSKDSKDSKDSGGGKDDSASSKPAPATPAATKTDS